MPSLASLYIGDNRTSGVTPTNGTPNGANGSIDEFYVYSTDVSGPQFEADMNLTRPNCTVLDHFRIIHDGSATCGVAQVTIEAHDASHALFSLAGTTMMVSSSTGHGTWSAVSAINPVVNTVAGTATYTFANENRVVLALTNPYVETVNINVASGSITEHSGAASTCTASDYTYGSTCDADLAFVSCVGNFECLESGLSYNNLTSNPTARNPLYTKLVGASFAFDVVALDTGGNRVTNFASDANKTVTVELVDASGGACASLPALSPAVSTTLTFAKASQPTEQGRKAVGFTVNRAHAGLRCRVTDASQTPSVQGCSSDVFAIRPQQFTMTADLGGPTLKAGHDFTLAANSGASAGYSGAPVLDAARVRDHLGNPAGTLAGSLAAATGATASGIFQYHDVGTLSLLADAVTDAAFTGVDQPDDCIVGSTSNAASGGKYGCVIGSAVAGPFGRFYPDHFSYVATLTPAYGSGASGFSYMSQPALGINMALEARSLGGNVAARYTVGYGFLGTFAITADNNGSVVSVARLDPALPAFAWNNGRYAVNSTTAAFARSTAPDGPFESFALKASILAEPDGVAISGTNLSNTSRIRFGRLRLVNFYGSELLSPRVEFRAEYWDGNRWATNALDSSNPIIAGNIATGGLTVNGVTALINGMGYITFNTAAAGSYDTALNLNAAGSDASCNAAHGGTAANKPWLQGYWSAPANCGGVAAWAQDPNARIRLGSPRAPYIYLRERY
jgi:MSHA biogenesis protein MshQ